MVDAQYAALWAFDALIGLFLLAAVLYWKMRYARGAAMAPPEAGRGVVDVVDENSAMK